MEGWRTQRRRRGRGEIINANSGPQKPEILELSVGGGLEPLFGRAVIVIHDAAGLSQNPGRLRLKCWIRGECIDHRCWVYGPVEGRHSGWRRAPCLCVRVSVGAG